MRALAIDDNPTSLSLMKHLLGRIDGCEPVTVDNPLQALEMAATGAFDIVLVDYLMPEMDGITVIRRMRAMETMRYVPIIMVTGDDERSTRIEALEVGATDFLSKPIEPVELRARIRNLVALRQAQVAMAKRADAFEKTAEKATHTVVEREHEMLWRLARAIETRDGTTGVHIVRMAGLCRLIAEKLGLGDLEVEMIHLAAPLHDIGKIGVPDSVLDKAGPLTADERMLIEAHVEIGESILGGATSDLLRVAADIASSHHERWDGTGYPRGLAEGRIPLVGRIAAIADVFDALVSPRPYKPAWSAEKARAHIIEASGSQFDPRCVEAFLENWDAICQLYRRFQPTQMTTVKPEFSNFPSTHKTLENVP